MRTFGLDVHKRFIEVALHEDGRLTRVGQVEMDQLEVFADSLGPEDHLVIESTASAAR